MDRDIVPPSQSTPQTPQPAPPKEQREVWVCQHESCRRNGAIGVLAALRAAEDVPEDVVIYASNCLGQCSVGPTVRVLPEETWYCRFSVADVPRFVKEHLQGGQPLDDKLHPRFHRSYY